MTTKPGRRTGSILPSGSSPLLILLVLWLVQIPSMAQQTIRLEAEDQPLNQVLLELARDYDIRLSFDDRQLSAYSVTASKLFKTPEEAIAYLIDPIPMEYRVIGGVYTIYREHHTEQVNNYLISGTVVDDASLEALPYSHILINGSGTVTDLGGRFTRLSTDSVFHLTVSYLGYYVKDTVLHAGTGQRLRLVPSTIGLREVVIEGSRIERSGQAGEEAGVIRLNHKIAYRLPGNGDNSVFNFLRLQPGILAAGERSSELIIWGSYSGQSKVMFDGFTLFGLKNFNDNISFVNPYMAKDIRVLKGGYPVAYDDRVGGIVEISGIEGNHYKPSINLNINNMTVNGMAGFPIGERSSITFAYRHTYYNLVDAGDLSIVSRGRRPSGQADITVFPDYLFRDLNLKYSGNTEEGDNYFISLYNGRDLFSYELEQERTNADISQESREGNRQWGGTAFYGKTWKNGIISHLSLNLSGLEKELFEKHLVTGNAGTEILSGREILYTNQITEAALNNRNQISLFRNHLVETGWNYTLEEFGFSEDSLATSLSSNQGRSHRIGVFIQDDYSPVRGLTLQPGIRLDYPVQTGRIYVQPRIRISMDLSGHWRLNAAAGLYNQFISEASTIDELGNYHYFWTICDNEEVPVLSAVHLVGGLAYKQQGFSLSLEGFYKTTEGLTRYFTNWKERLVDLYTGRSRVYGMDLLLKQYYRKHEAWVSYTLSRTEEYFPFWRFTDYRDAPQDQRHEVKGALLLNFKPFYFSANYVYGSGFRAVNPFTNFELERYPYNRLDLALIYRYSFRSYHAEAGISILNVLNHENIKYSNVVRVPGPQSNSISIHAEAVPFTPTLYLNLSF